MRKSIGLHDQVFVFYCQNPHYLLRPQLQLQEPKNEQQRSGSPSTHENKHHHLRIHCQSIPDHACIRCRGVCHPPEAACNQEGYSRLMRGRQQQHLTHNWNGFVLSSEHASGAASWDSSSGGRIRGSADAVPRFTRCTSALLFEATQRDFNPYLQLQP